MDNTKPKKAKDGGADRVRKAMELAKANVESGDPEAAEVDYKTVHIPLDLHQQLKREVIDLGPGWNLRRLLVAKLSKPLSKKDVK